MSKISAIKLQLAKILASFSSLNTDKGILEWPDEKEIEVGLEVFVEDAEGNYVPAEDGEYVANGTIITIEGGKVVSIVLPEPTVEPTVELEEEPVDEPAVDPLAEIKNEIKEIASIVASLVDKVASLEAETATTRETLEKMSKMSVAMSSVEIEKTPVSKTGNPKLDARLKEMFK